MAITSFALAFFIPVYFAMIGLGLDLIHGFSVVFFSGSCCAACAIKAVSVYLGARAAGEDTLLVGEPGRRDERARRPRASWSRRPPSRPASSTSTFFAVLVLLAIITSLAAGAWLERVPRERLLVRAGTRRGRGGAPRPAAAAR